MKIRGKRKKLRHKRKLAVKPEIYPCENQGWQGLNTPLSRVDQINFLDIFLGSIEEKRQPSVLHLTPGAGPGFNAENDLTRLDAVVKNY